MISACAIACLSSSGTAYLHSCAMFRALQVSHGWRRLHLTFRVRQGRQDAVGRDLGRWVREGVGIFLGIWNVGCGR
ncbi:hypothetical protein BDQ94DRAFT_136758 [Aspergillus welwitschiae]|uniref:Uncharacterized protein n=1 Tax=Aspergillus welwitschiae TaxID=1341132 RepID=A0A3F3QEB6_9EURO|nr:hypothetical protein BDQ94DRAFT_136758 [Aspergillus welwitschiae]RDH37624.1 hypothetical protein BDQ94DRAFT_136758 [Aspergillus welwitschiae]